MQKKQTVRHIPKLSVAQYCYPLLLITNFTDLH